MEQGSHQLKVGARSREEKQQCLQNQPLLGGSTNSASASRPPVVIQVEADDPLGLNRIKNSLLDQPRNGSRNGGAAGDNSPESTSLYSDEIPSGYNSGEQYDTLSTGYMSGEAYELPETRMELREPALDPIEEGHNSLGGGANSDDNIFHHLAAENANIPGLTGGEDKHSTTSLTSTSSSDGAGMVGTAMDGGSRVGGPIEANVLHHSPLGYTGVKTKLRKKVTTFANPPTDLTTNGLRGDDDLEAYESSDACVAVTRTAGGYRAVPSDTDTSAVDSDANAVLTDGGNESSATELLRAAHRQSKSGQKRLKKNLSQHDENWFNSRDNKYWSCSRLVCFWMTMLSMVGSVISAGILIYLMPTNCDPERSWYQGSVVMDFRVSSKSDLIELQSKLNHYASMGIQALHLRDVTIRPDANSSFIVDMYHPTSMAIDIAQKVLADGAKYVPEDLTSLKQFTKELHSLNMTMIVQLPVVGTDPEYKQGNLSITLQHDTELAIKYWVEQGVDGVFLDGMEHFVKDRWIGSIVKHWHDILERYGSVSKSRNEKILMTSYKLAKDLVDQGNLEGQEAFKYIALLDATLDLSEVTNLTETSDLVSNMSMWDSLNDRPWINWNLRFVRDLPLSNAAAAFQMLLPGTINIGNLDDSRLPAEQLRNMTSLRTVAVPIYMNGNYKRCECEGGTTKETNYILHHPIKDVIQLERFYSRRNRYVLMANFGSVPESLSLIGRIYTGGEIVLDTSNALGELNTPVLFKDMVLPPGQAVIIKIPK